MTIGAARTRDRAIRDSRHAHPARRVPTMEVDQLGRDEPFRRTAFERRRLDHTIAQGDGAEWSRRERVDHVGTVSLTMQLDHMILPVNDAAASVAFYSEIMGFAD